MARKRTQLGAGRIRHGLIVWFDDCPALDDDGVKRRPVVGVDPDVPLADPPDDRVAIVVACSASYGPDETDGVEMPNLATQPQATTGLPNVCWAIPRWFLPVTHETLRRCDYAGTLGGTKLRRLMQNYLDRLASTRSSP